MHFAQVRFSPNQLFKHFYCFAAPPKVWKAVALWKFSLVERIAELKPITTPNSADDQDVANYRIFGANVIEGIERELALIDTVANDDARFDILKGMELRFGNSGRQMLGIAWRTMPCGVGIVTTKCGFKGKCMN